MIFILQVIGTSIAFFIFYLILVFLPLAAIGFFFRYFLYRISGKRINLMLRQELINLKHHKPGEGWYDEDVYSRNTNTSHVISAAFEEYAMEVRRNYKPK